MDTSHKQELIKGVYTDIFRRGIRVLNSQNRRNFDICKFILASFHFWRVAEGTSIRTFTLGSHRFWPLLCSVGSHIFLFFFFEGPKGRYGPHEVWAHMGWVGHPPH